MARSPSLSVGQRFLREAKYSSFEGEGLKCKHREGRRILNQSFIKSEGERLGARKEIEFAAVLAGIGRIRGGGGKDVYVGIRGVYTVGSRYI